MSPVAIYAPLALGLTRSGQSFLVRADAAEPRTEALYDAALRLLAKHDYETISIATIAREAGCSVGAFYGRFRDKEAFLQSVVSLAFRTLTVESSHELVPERWRGSPRSKTIHGLVQTLRTTMWSFTPVRTRSRPFANSVYCPWSEKP